jgi:hypothetical protein
MKWENQDLKKLYQSSLDNKQTVDQGCPDDDAIIQSFSPILSESEKNEIVDHISECSLCREKFTIAQQVFSEGKKMAADLEGMSLSEEETEELNKIARVKIKEMERPKHIAAGVSVKPRSLFWLWQKTAFKYATILAGFVIIVLVTFFLLKAPYISVEDTVRGVQDDIILLTNPKGDLTEIPQEFEWNPVQGATGYRVVLLDEELSEVWVSEKIPQTSLKLSQLLFEAIKRGRLYYWKVIVFSSDGGTRESGLQEFEVKIK